MDSSYLETSHAPSREHSYKSSHLTDKQRKGLVFEIDVADTADQFKDKFLYGSTSYLFSEMYSETEGGEPDAWLYHEDRNVFDFIEIKDWAFSYPSWLYNHVIKRFKQPRPVPHNEVGKYFLVVRNKWAFFRHRHFLRKGGLKYLGRPVLLMDRLEFYNYLLDCQRGPSYWRGYKEVLDGLLGRIGFSSNNSTVSPSNDKPSTVKQHRDSTETKQNRGNSSKDHQRETDTKQNTAEEKTSELLLELLRGIVEDMPLQQWFRHDFKYKDRPTGEFKEHLFSLLKSEYDNIDEVKALYDLLSSYLYVDTPKVEWTQSKENWKGLYIHQDRKILLKRPAKQHTVFHEYFHYLNYLDKPTSLDRVVYLMIVGLLSLPDTLPLVDSGELASHTLKQLLAEAHKELKAKRLLKNLEPQIQEFSIKK